VTPGEPAAAPHPDGRQPDPAPAVSAASEPAVIGLPASGLAASGLAVPALDVPRSAVEPAAPGPVAPGSAAAEDRVGAPGRVVAGAPEVGRFAAGTFGMTVTRLTARALGHALGRVEVTGADGVPRTGGLLLAVNHSAYIDGPLMYGVLRRPAVFMVKAEEFRGPVGAMLRRIGQIPVRRGVVERAPLQTALAVLAAGGVVAVFPEGSRGAGNVEAVQHGVAYLALRSGCPVLPVACHGSRAMQQLRGLRRPRVRIAFGRRVELPPTRTASRRNVTTAAERIRAAMAAHVTATRPVVPVGEPAGPQAGPAGPGGAVDGPSRLEQAGSDQPGAAPARPDTEV
jgi:1-acyl-sn-glycerol-3-phosphate acyltransferase